MQRMRVWLGTVAAVLVVALLAGVFLSRMHRTPGQTNNQHGSGPNTAGACAPGDIKVHLPANSYFGTLAMISPNEGWAVGGILDPASFGPANALIVHFHNCTWTAMPSTYPNAGLTSISMGSATDGWAVGSTIAGASSEPFALHYANGVWKQVTPPGKGIVHGRFTYSAVHMLSADDGWIVVNHEKDSQGLLKIGLLHLSNGRWSVVDAPFPVVEEVLPVAPNEAWIAGSASDVQETPVLYHYQAGTWTRVALPTGMQIDHLHMVSPSDIWASGHMSAQSNATVDQSAVVVHYDGSRWQQVAIGASGHPQIVEAFDSNTSWAITLTPTKNHAGFGYYIGGMQYQQDGAWKAVTWPFADLVYVQSITRVSADGYWAVGEYSASKPNPNGSGYVGYQVPVLLYFANGVWHQYGR